MKDLTYLGITDQDIGKIMRRAREDAIEECAQVADEYARVAKQANAPIQLMIAGERIAAFIRAQKDKP